MVINTLAKHLVKHKIYFFVTSIVFASILVFFSKLPVINNQLSGFNVDNNPYETSGIRIADLFSSKNMVYVKINPLCVTVPLLFESIKDIEENLIEVFPEIRIESLHKVSALSNRFSSPEQTVGEMLSYSAKLPVLSNLVSIDTTSFLLIAFVDDIIDFDPDLFDDIFQNEYKGIKSVAINSIFHIQRQTEKSILRDYLLILPAILIFIIAFLIYSYRSKGVLLFAFVNFVFSTICVFFFFSIFNVKINQLTASSILVVIILSISWSVHLLTAYFHYTQVDDKDERIREILRIYLLPILLTAVTTSIAFGSFFLSESLYVRQFGIVSAASLLTTFIFTVMNTPFVLGLISTPKQNLNRNSIVAQVKSTILKQRKSISIAFILVLPVSIFLIPKLTFKTNLETFIPKGTPIYKSNEEIKKSFFSMAEMDFLVEMKPEMTGNLSNREKRSMLLDAIDDLATEIATWQEVVFVQSIVDQNKFEERFSIPGIRIRFFSLSRNPYVSQDQMHYRINVKLKDSEDVWRVKKRFEEIFNKFEPKLKHSIYSDFLFFYYISSRITSSLLKSLLFSVILIIIILYLLTRSVRITAVSILANSIPLGFLVLIFVIFGLDLNITTSATLVVCLGIVVDDTIHILYRKVKLGMPLNELALGMLKTSFILTGGFCLFLLSQSTQIQLSGILKAIVFFIAIIGDLSIMSWLIKNGKKV